MGWGGTVGARATPLVRAPVRVEVRPLALPALVVAGCVLFQGLVGAGSWFAGDDWLHLTIAHDAATHGSLSLAYLDRPVFIHYAPGLRLGYWALEKLAPGSWTVALGTLLALFAGSLVVFQAILRQLFGERRESLVLTTLFGTSILLFTSFMWFADGLHKLPSTFLSLLAIHAYLRHRDSGSRLALAGSVAAVALGLLFYVKVALVPLYLLALELLLLRRRPRRALLALLAYLPPLALYAWNYERHYAALDPHHASIGVIAHYVWTSWFRGVAPSIAGFYVGLDPHWYALTGALVAQLVVACLVWRSGRGAWRAWTFLALAFVANAALVGAGRLQSFGFARVASDPRYDTELAWLIPLALGFAFLGTRRSPRAMTAGISVYLCLAVATGAITAHWWRAHQTSVPTTYAANVHRSLAQDADVVDYQVPEKLISSVDVPWNRPERFLPAVDSRARVTVASAHPRVLDDAGNAHAARVYPLGVRPRVGVVRAGAVSARRCARGGRPLAFEPAPEVAGRSLFARLSYEVRRRSAAPALITAHDPRVSPARVPLDRPSGSVVVNLGTVARAQLPAGAIVCVRSLSVGWLGR